MATLNTIKNWFKTGLKPTQQQFWDTWDSFWHKDDLIPASRVENLNGRFNEKADLEAFMTHVRDLSAHGKHGTFTAEDMGQNTILIPHGLGVVPGYWNVRGKNNNAKNIGLADESADENHLILTPAFTNNDHLELTYLWEAKL